MKFNQLVEETLSNVKAQGFKNFFKQEIKDQYKNELTIKASIADLERVLGPRKYITENDEITQESGFDDVWAWEIPNRATAKPLLIYTDPLKPTPQDTNYKFEMNQKRDFHIFGLEGTYKAYVIVEILARLLKNEVEFLLWAPNAKDLGFNLNHMPPAYRKVHWGSENEYSILGDDFQGIHKLSEMLRKIDKWTNE